MKKTKIVCTLGPKSCKEEVITAMAQAGMNVARINMSHGSHEEHAVKIVAVKKVRERLGIPIALLLDTKGPEFRIGTFKEGKAMLKEGELFSFVTEDIVGDNTQVSVSYKNLCEEMFPGDTILLNNGLLTLEVVEVKKPKVICKVIVGGETSDKKSVFFPDKEFKMTYLSEQDKKDLLYGIHHDFDFIACSFVSKAQDIIEVKEFLAANNAPADIDIIAKIENRAGVNNLKSILEVADGIMIGRGDLGVEIPYYELPDTQKYIINETRKAGKRCITATEMLESMIEKQRPTRAEISDVANAVYDGSSAVMLSGETAAGKYPVKVVEAMSNILMQAEKHPEFMQFLNDSMLIHDTYDALSHSACTLAKDIDAKAIVVCTKTGRSARMVSRFRPMMDIIATTTNERAFRKLALSWGVIPMMSDEFTSVDVLFHFAKQAAKASGIVKSGDTIVITGGTPNGKGGNADLINITHV